VPKLLSIVALLTNAYFHEADLDLSIVDQVRFVLSPKFPSDLAIVLSLRCHEASPRLGRLNAIAEGTEETSTAAFESTEIQVDIKVEVCTSEIPEHERVVLECLAEQFRQTALTIYRLLQAVK